MNYRNFGDLGFKSSAFGLGCMRFPLLKNDDGTDSKEIDQQKTTEMIRYAIDNGVTYIDTAYPYHYGESENVVGRALKDGYREKVILVTKCPVWATDKYEDFETILDEQLKKLQVEYVDFYLLHALNRKTWEKINKINVFDFIKEAKEKGKIKHVGFSFHDELPLFKEIIDAYDFEMCQIQLNLLDEYYQAGLEGMRYAAAKGVPVVIMEPLKGGVLANNVPEDIKKIYNDYNSEITPVEWAFKFLYNFKEVVTILSGCSTLEQVKDNIRIFSKSEVDKLNEKDLELINTVKTKYKEKIKVGCTGCNYCMPCPSNVNIPEIFATYNYSSLFDFEVNKNYYNDQIVKDNKDSSKCVECGKCESACPQGIHIIDKLKEAALCFS